MFDGKVRGNRAVSASGKKRESDKEAFLVNTRKQREDRAVERKKLLAVVRLQSSVRRCLVRKSVSSKFKLELDKKVSDIKCLQLAFKSRGSQFNIPLDVLLPIFRAYLFSFEGEGFKLVSPNDIDKLKRITSILRLLLDSLTVKVPGSFNPFIQALNEIEASKSEHRPWGYQLLGLCRLSVRLLHSYLLLGESNYRCEFFVSNRDLVISAVQTSLKVVQTLLNWQKEIAFLPVPQIPNNSDVMVVEESGTSMKKNRNFKDCRERDAETLLTSLARYTASSCACALRLAIVEGKKSMINAELVSETTGLLLSFIQESIRPVEILKASFKAFQNRNVSTAEFVELTILILACFLTEYHALQTSHYLCSCNDI